MEFVSSFGGGDGLRVEETLGNGYVRLRISEAERRQAKHDIRCVEDAVIELLRNARDAGARNIFVASGRDGDVRSVYVIDDGSGIPASMHVIFTSEWSGVKSSRTVISPGSSSP